MKRLELDNQWPEVWQLLYSKDEAELYDKTKFIGQYYAYNTRMGVIINFIKNSLPTNSRILDVAAAQGNYSLKLAELGYDVTWNDIREEIIDYVKLKYEYGRISYKIGNIFDFDESVKYDLIIACEIIEHLAHPNTLITKLSSLLKENGYIVLTTPNGNYFKNNLPRFSSFPNPEIFEGKQFLPDSDGHIFLLISKELEDFSKKSNLNIVEIKHLINFLTHGHIKLHKILKYFPTKFINWFEISLQGNNFLKVKINSHLFIVLQKLSEGLN